MKGLKRILKKGGVITAQVGSHDKKPKQVENWCKVLSKSFENVKLTGAYIPSFDCNWNFCFIYNEVMFRVSCIQLKSNNNILHNLKKQKNLLLKL